MGVDGGVGARVGIPYVRVSKSAHLGTSLTCVCMGMADD